MDDPKEAIRTLFDRYADDVYRYAKYSLPPEFDAKDVVQEVFLRAFHHWHNFKGDAEPKTWLLRIARNHIYDLLRKKQRQRVYEAAMSLENSSAQLETIIELEDALTRMTLHHRQVLNLRWLQGLSVPETADVLGWSESKVRVTFHRAKKKLRELLNEPSSDAWSIHHTPGGDAAHGK